MKNPPKTLLTIHNLAFQGIFLKKYVERLLRHDIKTLVFFLIFSAGCLSLFAQGFAQTTAQDNTTVSAEVPADDPGGGDGGDGDGGDGVNGRGGGKADLAQGSGKGAAGIDAALAAVRAEIGRG